MGTQILGVLKATAQQQVDRNIMTLVEPLPEEGKDSLEYVQGLFYLRASLTHHVIVDMDFHSSLNLGYWEISPMGMGNVLIRDKITNEKRFFFRIEHGEYGHGKIFRDGEWHDSPNGKDLQDLESFTELLMSLKYYFFLKNNPPFWGRRVLLFVFLFKSYGIAFQIRSTIITQFPGSITVRAGVLLGIWSVEWMFMR
ncbi:hypothetical protein HC823_01575 [Candidatus Gracilibacteria bacterium]|nr:hypothetical protein [Candidatus Gracilibacteria bacterium]